MADRTHIDGLLAWLAQGGAVWADNIEIRYDDMFGWAPFSTAPLDADTDVLRVPFNLVLTPQLGDEAFAGLTGKQHLVDALQPLEESSRLAGYVALHWMEKAKEGPLNWSLAPQLLQHSAYIDSLPTTSTSPTSYSPSELSLLSGTPVPSATTALLASWQQQHSALSALVGLDESHGFTLARFNKAMQLIASRSFPSRLLDVRSLDPLAQEPSAEDEAQTLSHPILIPGWDLSNHRPLTPISWITTPPVGSKQGTLALVHHFPIGMDQQIFNNYGSKPSSSLLLSYGFALPLDKQPEGMETLPLLLGGIPPRKQGISNKLNVPWNKTWDLVLIDGYVEPPTGLRRLLRIVVADEQEEATLLSDPEAVNSPLSGDSELSALIVMQELLLSKLELLETIAANPPPPDVRPEVVDVCRIYRDNQILLLREAEAWVGRELVGVAREFGIDLDEEE